MDHPYLSFGLSQEVCNAAQRAEERIAEAFSAIEQIRARNQLKVLRAFKDVRLSDVHFNYPTGYGYDDVGREKIEQIYANIFGGEAAYVRIQISSGTQAIAACLFGILRSGDRMLSVMGRPYDTLCTVIGSDKHRSKPVQGSLCSHGIGYDEVALKKDGAPDFGSIASAITPKTKLVLIQKSKGYALRPSLTCDQIEKIVDIVKSVRKDIIVFVDNCYGEFVEASEPCAHGADLCAGSLIKNPGGGICPSGGYIVGRSDCVEAAAAHLCAPGVVGHVGPSLGFNRTLAQGLFFAPHIVAESLKGAVFSAALFEDYGFKSVPAAFDKRGDIVQTVQLDHPDQVIDLCRVVQSCSPVDAHVTPYPWDMPGYDAQVIMAAGAFVQGASIELSADGPMEPPYIVYMQGGLVYEQVKLAAMTAADKMEVHLK